MTANRWDIVFEEAVAVGNGEAFTDAVFDFGLEIMGEPGFPGEDFEAILKIMTDRRFHALEGAWNLIAVFNYEWDMLSSTQQDRLLAVLEDVFSSFTDWMSPFYIAELLGERYADRRAVDTFERLKKTRNHVARSFVPHGLEHLVRRAHRETLISNRALDTILSMRGDLSDQVTGEVDQAIARLADAGVIGRA